jgi:hypothetical protein
MPIFISAQAFGGVQLNLYEYIVLGYPRDFGTCEQSTEKIARDFTRVTGIQVARTKCWDNIRELADKGKSINYFGNPLNITIFYWAATELDRETTDSVNGDNREGYFINDLEGAFYDFYTGGVNLGSWFTGYRESNERLKLRNYTGRASILGIPENLYNDYVLIDQKINSTLNTGNIELVLPPN